MNSPLSLLRKSSPRLPIALFACFLFTSDPRAEASADSDQVARGATRAAAETYAREALSHATNDAVENWTSGAISTAGTTAFAVADFVRALNDLSDADTPEQRVEAGTRAGVAVYALAGGPAAPAIALGLTVRQLLHAAEDAELAKELAKIYQRRAEHMKRVFEVRTELATADYYWLAALYFRVLSFSASLEKYSAYVGVRCADPTQIRTSEELDECLVANARVVWSLNGLVGAGTDLLTYRSGIVASDVFLRSDELSDEENAKRPFAISRAALEKAVQHYSVAFKKQHAELEKVLQTYSDAMSLLLKQEVALDSREANSALARCTVQLTTANSSAAAALLAWQLAKTHPGAKKVMRADLAESRLILGQLLAAPCHTFVNVIAQVNGRHYALLERSAALSSSLMHRLDEALR